MRGENLNNKFLLVDTNVLISIKNNPPEKFEDFFKIIENKKCKLCVNKFIKNEFLFGAKTKKSLDECKKFLKERFSEFNLSTEKEEKIIEEAFELHRIYCTEGSIDKNQINFVDCLNGSFLLNRPEEIFMLTADIKDFPLKIFDRLEVFAIDFDKDVITLAVYKFNDEKYKTKKKALKNLV